MAKPSQFLAISPVAKKEYAEVTGEDMDGDALPHPSSIPDLRTFLDKENVQVRGFHGKAGLFVRRFRGYL